MKTVATYPRTIFFVTVATVSISLVLLSFVRLPNASEYHRQGLLDLEEPTSDADRVQERTLVGLEDRQAEEGATANDTGLKKRVMGLPSYGSAAKPSSTQLAH
jgi:ParB-like chromosome segregation protein Spo0J